MRELATRQSVFSAFFSPLKPGRTPQQIALSSIISFSQPQTQPASVNRRPQSLVYRIKHGNFTLLNAFFHSNAEPIKYCYKADTKLPVEHRTAKKRQSYDCRSVLALPIFPGRCQPSIVGRDELNYRVRNGNGWTLALISTNYSFGCPKNLLHYNVFRTLCQQKVW